MWLSQHKIENPQHLIRIADVDISLECTGGLIDLKDTFRLAESEPKALLVIVPYKGAKNVYYLNDKILNDLVRLEENRLVCEFPYSKSIFSRFIDVELYPLSEYAGYLAGILSNEYVMCHGAGIRIGEKGIVLVGRTDSGKSTLASILEGEVLSDDTIMVSTTHMQTIGKKRALIDKKNGRIRWPNRGIIQSQLDYIFILNKSREPDYFRALNIKDETEEHSLVDAMFDDKLDRVSGSLRKPYEERLQRFQWPSQIFEVGTKREPRETKRTIEYIVAHS